MILDAPPLLGVADARILAAKADRVLYVVHWNKTPSSAAQSAVEILQSCGANVVGAILSKVNVKKQARYGYGDASDYFNYYRHYYITQRLGIAMAETIRRLRVLLGAVAAALLLVSRR